MRSGPTNRNVRKIIIGLERSAKKSKRNVLADLSSRLSGPSRRRAEVNVYELSKLAKAAQGKVIVVPGKVLAKGDISEKVEVACLSISSAARKKIEAAKGKIMTLN